MGAVRRRGHVKKGSRTKRKKEGETDPEEETDVNEKSSHEGHSTGIWVKNMCECLGCKGGRRWTDGRTRRLSLKLRCRGPIRGLAGPKDWRQ